ncbi:MAG TPA: hypothetical protein DD417_11890 [Elusimicrobia bacterium]|nr:hypothetical protein [Elusimicrobiota bacterium]
MKKKIPMLALLGLMGLTAAAPRAAQAEDARISRLVTLSVGYKLWYNSWETAIPSYTNGGTHVNAITAGPVGAHIPNMSVKVWKFLVSGSVMTSNNYRFPAFKDTFIQGGTGFTTADRYYRATRKEYDINTGFYVTPNIVATVGYKSVEQRYQETISNVADEETRTWYKGPTFGLAGGAGIGYGFSLYGNGALGYMHARYSGSSSRDIANYEAMEVGLAWRWKVVSASLGYKFQYITTRGEIDAADVSRGYIMGLNLNF